MYFLDEEIERRYFFIASKYYLMPAALLRKLNVLSLLPRANTENKKSKQKNAQASA